MARKSSEEKVIAENLQKIAGLTDQIRTLQAVNEALAAIRESKKKLKARPLALAKEA